MRAAHDPFRMHVQRTGLVHQARDVRHGYIISMTKTCIEKRSAKERISHGVESRFQAFIASLDQCNDFRILVINRSGMMTGKAWMVPGAQVPLIKRNLDPTSHPSFINRVDHRVDV